jgi:hypothetical protein
MRTLLFQLMLSSTGGTPLQYSLLGVLGTVAALGCVAVRFAG